MVRYRGGIMIGCNGLPSFTDDKGEHIFERILLIMCLNVIPEERRDPELLDKMYPEVPAIINWMLQGLHRLLDNNYKFSKSASSENATKDYRSQLDTVYRFIQEGEICSDISRRELPYRVYYTITRNPDDQVLKRDFYQCYEQWCNSSEIDVTPIKKKNLNQRLEALGCQVDRRGTVGDSRGVYTIRGMKCINEITGDNRAPTKEEIADFLKKKCPQKSPQTDEKSPQEGFTPQIESTPFD